MRKDLQNLVHGLIRSVTCRAERIIKIVFPRYIMTFMRTRAQEKSLLQENVMLLISYSVLIPPPGLTNPM